MSKLDEAIKYCNEEAEAWKKDVERFDKVYYKHGQTEAAKKYAGECAEEAEFYEQLAKWLIELKELREIVEKSEKRPKFHWIHPTKDWDVCSNCLLGFKGIVVDKDNFNFCPFCGAERDKSAETAEVENETCN